MRKGVYHQPYRLDLGMWKDMGVHCVSGRASLLVEVLRVVHFSRGVGPAGMTREEPERRQHTSWCCHDVVVLVRLTIT